MDTQQGDVLLFQTNDDGDISVVGGITEMTGDFRTMAYLCLFGGNEEDDGRENNPKTWWGNRDEVDPDFKYVSETQHLLRALTATSGNLLKLEDAAGRDLKVFTSKGIASSVSVVATIPALNRVAITIEITAEGEESQFTFTENWKAGIS